jgi:hypothetical protein
MADQKGRGGQKQATEKQGQGKNHQGTRTHEEAGQRGPKSMQEDAQRGRQGNQGGYQGG